MRRFVVKRLLWSLFSALGAVIVVFFMLRLSGDPARLMLPPEASQAEVAALHASLGLNAPLWQQFASYVASIFQGNLGESLYFKQPAFELVVSRLPATLLLACTAIALSSLLGLAVGIVTAAKKHTPLDYLLNGVVLFGQSMPVFWIGILLILVFAVTLNWLPTSGFDDGIYSLILPSVALSFYSAAPIARTTRASLIRVLQENYITVARAQGFCPWQILLHRALKNALLPVITVIGLEFGSMLGGAVVSETVFSWPGVGRLIMQGIANRDFPLVQAGILVISLLYILTNLTVDLLYLRLNPRIRRE